MTPMRDSSVKWRDTVLLVDPACWASLRIDGKHRPARSANDTRHCIVQRRCGRNGRYRSMTAGTNGSKGASTGAAAPARKRLTSGALYRCTPKGLAKIRGFGEALDRQISCFRETGL